MNSEEFIEVLAGELDAAMRRRRRCGFVRAVFGVRCDRVGDVVALVHRGSQWSPRQRCDVVADISSGRATYVVAWETGEQVVWVTPDGRLDVLGPDGRPGGLLLLLPLG